MQQAIATEYRELLLNYLQAKKNKNALFSLRSLAKQLKISPAQLSQFISGKRPLTLNVALKIADKLELSSLERQRMFESIQGNEKSRSGPLQKFKILDEDQFRVISEWYYFGILSLGHLPKNQASPAWIAKRLNIDVHTARSAYERLKRLNYIEEQKGQFRQSAKPLHTTAEISSVATRKYHRQNLELAAQKLDEIDLHQREYTSITMPVDPKRLVKAKEMMNYFKNELCKFLGSGEKSEVYTLALQLFPITILKENKE